MNRVCRLEGNSVTKNGQTPPGVTLTHGHLGLSSAPSISYCSLGAANQLQKPCTPLGEAPKVQPGLAFIGLNSYHRKPELAGHFREWGSYLILAQAGSDNQDRKNLALDSSGSNSGSVPLSKSSTTY